MDCDKQSIVWSPDSKSLPWSEATISCAAWRSRAGKEEVVATADTGNIGGPQFSPDGKWISYWKQDKLAALARVGAGAGDRPGKAYHSDQFQIAGGAKWTPDGKKLLVIGGVGLPAMASQGFRGTPAQLFAISLTRIDKDPDDRDINTEEQALAALKSRRRTRRTRSGRRGSGGGREDRVGRHRTPRQETDQRDQRRRSRWIRHRTAGPTPSVGRRVRRRHGR